MEKKLDVTVDVELRVDDTVADYDKIEGTGLIMTMTTDDGQQTLITGKVGSALLAALFESIAKTCDRDMLLEGLAMAASKE